MNVVITSRSLDKLEPVAKAVRAAGVQCKPIAFDFFAELPAYDAIAAQLKDLTVSLLRGSRSANALLYSTSLCQQVTVLVNNVGGSGISPIRHNTESTKLFIDRDIADFEKTLILNTRPLITMTVRSFFSASSRVLVLCAVFARVFALSRATAPFDLQSLCSDLAYVLLWCVCRTAYRGGPNAAPEDGRSHYQHFVARRRRRAALLQRLLG